ncbi:transketolase [Marininema halotolerans]|uniref:Transketolase n=1 Tax=Marininema halotolerans TaxID=1155944 RepID=A0A1I6RR71_9BACL|nr:transketolase [Marininema halotolerans]SFS67219.1 transketolase [Marininema halotolerans]
MSNTRDHSLESLAVNTIRMLSIDAVEKANSGHPGMPMGAAPMAYALWAGHLKHNPANPNWFDRDRFILSAGHGSALLYSLLHLFGYGLSMEEMKNFRQWGSLTPGHPEANHGTPGVEATTGPLGQGISNAVGFAMAEAHLAARYNQDQFPVIDHFTYTICSDGDLMEGISHESASLAGHLQLGKLIALYDSNDISLDGNLAESFSEDIQKRYESYGWQVLRVEGENDLKAISQAIEAGQKETTKPTLIEVKTTIGFGSPNLGGTNKIHGAPFGPDEREEVKKAYGWEWEEPFYVPGEVSDHFQGLKAAGEQAEDAWNLLFAKYKESHPALAHELEMVMQDELPANWEEALPTYQPTDKAVATRSASGDALNAVAQGVPTFFGGSADLASSNKTELKNQGVFHAENYAGRNIWFGVREHGMGAALNGMALHGGVRPFGATFLVFSDYLRPSIRLAALSKLPVLYVFTHDSISVGEDGPTHEPVEQIPSLRLIPNLKVFRPADANETVAAYRYALNRHDGPVLLALSRQNLPILEGTAEAATGNALKGGYVLADSEGTPDVILIATGSEVSLAIEAQEKLFEQGVNVRVVSMPCRELFLQQPEAYRESVLPHAVTARVAIEAAHPVGWEQVTGDRGAIIGIDTFGASAPGNLVLEKYGFNVDNVVTHAERVMKA